jgi:hypothetical protein
MSEHHGFDGEEWDVLTEAPLDIYLGIMNADIAVDSLEDERVALDRWLERSSQDCGEDDWMRAVIRDAKMPSRAQAHGRSSLGANELIPKLSALSAALGRRVPEPEADRFKRLLLKLAEQVATASEGAFAGAPRISKAEGDLIWAIRRALGV